MHPARALATILLVAAASCGMARAQRHSLGSTPPTAPPLPAAEPAPARPLPGAAAGPAVPPAGGSSLHGTPGSARAAAAPVPTGPVAAVSSGLGPIQFVSTAQGVPAPQTLTRQLSAEDERTREGALTSVGAPGQYLVRGHIPFPHSVELNMLQLGTTEELDALLTVELDHHVVSAVLVPDGDSWKRIATLSFASSFSAGTTTPSNFVQPVRSWLQPGRYRAVYRAAVTRPDGEFTENEADVRVINGHAVVVVSFVSGAVQCDSTAQTRPIHPTCELLQRWMEADPSDVTRHLTLVTATGRTLGREGAEVAARSRNFRFTRLHSFACQPFQFSDTTLRFEPTANSSPCNAREAARYSERSSAPAP